MLINKYKIGIASLLMIAFVSIFTVSCKKNDEAVPSIASVRIVAKDSTTTDASFSGYIAIKGSGFDEVNGVKFNGIPAILNPNYVTSNTIVVMVPAKFPSEITNMLEVTTKNGMSYSFPFTVLVPKPVIKEVAYALSKNKLSILGENLAQIKSVSIGGIAIDTAKIVKDPKFKFLTFDVPTNIPSGSVILSLEAAAGRAQSSFDLESASAPAITAIPAEWVDEGGLFTLNGRNLGLIDRVVINDNIIVNEGFTSNDDNSSLGFSLPAGVNSGTIKVKVYNKLGKVSNELSSKFKTSSFLFFNFDDKGICFGAPAARFVLQPQQPISGKYFAMVGNMSPSWWDESNMVCSCDMLPSNISAVASNYVLKFEINVSKPWSAGAIRITFGTPPNTDADNTNEKWVYDWKPYETDKPYQTNGWQTVSIPLSNLNLSSSAVVNNLRFKFFIPGDAKVGASNVAVYVDNIRIDEK